MKKCIIFLCVFFMVEASITNAQPAHAIMKGGPVKTFAISDRESPRQIQEYNLVNMAMFYKPDLLSASLNKARFELNDSMIFSVSTWDKKSVNLSFCQKYGDCAGGVWIRWGKTKINEGGSWQFNCTIFDRNDDFWIEYQPIRPYFHQDRPDSFFSKRFIFYLNKKGFGGFFKEDLCGPLVIGLYDTSKHFSAMNSQEILEFKSFLADVFYALWLRRESKGQIIK